MLYHPSRSEPVSPRVDAELSEKETRVEDEGGETQKKKKRRCTQMPIWAATTEECVERKGGATE